MSEYTSKADFSQSYNTLHSTFKTGRTKSIQWRKWQLKQIWWMLDENTDAILEAVHQDLNKPAFEALFAEVAGVKSEILYMLDHLEKWSKGEAPPDAGFFMGTVGKAWLRKEPLGVALIIGAWNFPFYTLLAPFVSAVSAGMIPHHVPPLPSPVNLLISPTRQLRPAQTLRTSISSTRPPRHPRPQIPRPDRHPHRHRRRRRDGLHARAQV